MHRASRPASNWQASIWDNIALLVWHAPLPEAETATAVEAFVQRGGQVVFLPPKAPNSTAFMGAQWLDWVQEKTEIPVETWRGDQDILANTQSGASLPVGSLQIRRSCGLTGEFTALATLKGGKPLLARVPSSRGGLYFCATTPDTGDSSLATNGVVLYAFVQRALAAGVAVLGQTRQLVAGDASTEEPTTWRQIIGPPEALSTDYQHHSGIYATGDKLLAVNPSASENQAPVLSDVRVGELFKGLDFSRVDDRAGSLTGLIQEIWRPFLTLMMIALLVEAVLCLPRRPVANSPENRGFRRTEADVPVRSATAALTASGPD